MSCRYRLLAVADGFLCLFVFFPLAILHWRGTWGLQDVYFYPQDEAISGWISFTFGAVGCIIMLLVQPHIFQYIPADRKVTYFVSSRLFMYVNSWFVMGYWRGVWDLFDHYLTPHWFNSVVLYGFCQFIALVTCTARNNVGLPFSLSLDTQDDILKPDQLFSVGVSTITDCMCMLFYLCTCVCLMPLIRIYIMCDAKTLAAFILCRFNVLPIA